MEAVPAERVVEAVPKHLLIGGDWTSAADGDVIEVVDPATGQAIAEVASGAPSDALDAVAAADAAAGAWAATAPRERAEVLRRAFEAMVARREELARIIVVESGKSWADATGEVAYAAEFFRWFSEEAVRLDGRLTTAPAGDKRILTVLRPIGVSVLVTPWNFPAAMATRKIGPALAAGCTLVLKPASATPLTALMIASILEEAGAPAGVVNVVVAGRSGPVVAAMLEDSRVRKLSFTGSTEVGKRLLAQASAQVLDCSMELGGNAPFVVLDDADVDAAVDGAMVAKMRNGGASCIAANRFIVAERVVEPFAERLAARMAALKVGPGSDPSNDLGPMIDEQARDDVAELVGATRDAGATALVGGRVPDRAGSFYEPTVLVDVGQGDPMLATEVFGPVAPIVSVGGDDEALAMANDTIHGLAGYVYGRDLGRAMRVAEGIEAGVVGVNRGFVSDPAAPFGGMKQSGLGREGAHEGVLAFTATQYLAVSWS